MAKPATESSRPEFAGSSTVHIVGPLRLQNALLAELLGRQEDLSCRIHPAVPPPSEIAQDPDGSELLLIDFHAMNGREWKEPSSVTAWTRRALVALFNLQNDFPDLAFAMRCGIRGFFFVEDSPELIERGVSRILEGVLWVPRRRLEACVRGSDGVEVGGRGAPGGLTRREAEILRLVAEGATNAAIAERICVSAHTVKTHLYNIYRKLEVGNRLQAVQWTTKNFL